MRMSRFIVLDLARRLAEIIGGVLLSRSGYDQILLQRKHAVAELVLQERQRLSPGVAGIVFSKDRALQLFSMLHSYFGRVANPAPLTVIYGASSSAHEKAYLELMDSMAGHGSMLRFIPDRGEFRSSLLSVLDQMFCDKVFFLVDDIVFIRELDLSVAERVDPYRAILSFRHGPHLRRSYTADVGQSPPEFSPSPLGPNWLEFDWFEQGNEWSDPWSVDGQVLATAEVRVLTRISEFKAPNTYEAALKTFNDMVRGRKGLCLEQSVTLNLPLNRVQSEVANICGTVSPEFLLGQWNQGMMLDTTVFATHLPLAPHEEHPVRFVRRP